MISSLTFLLLYVHALKNVLQAGHKRTKSVDDSAAPAEKVVAPAADNGAKQALENEFECTICRVSNRAVVELACYQSEDLRTGVLLQTSNML